jgi:hypothetical protein
MNKKPEKPGKDYLILRNDPYEKGIMALIAREVLR